MKRSKALLVGDYSSYYRSELWASTAIEERYTVSFATKKYYGHKSRISRLWAYIPFSLELAFKLCFAEVVVLLPMNHNAIFQLLLMKKIFRYKLISDLYISAYDRAVDRKELRGKRNERYIKELDKLIIEKSDVIVHFSKSELSYISKKVGADIPNNKYFNIPLSVPKREFIAAPEQEYFGVCWWGTYVPLHGINKILEAARYIKENYPTSIVRFFLFGIDASEKRDIEEFIKIYDMSDWVTFRTDCTFSNGRLLEELKEKCNLALGIFGDSEKAKNTIANKVIDASSMGLPILTMDSALTKEYFGDLVFYCLSAPRNIADTILDLSKKNEWNDRKKALHEHFKNKYSFENAKKRMKEVLEK